MDSRGHFAVYSGHFAVYSSGERSAKPLGADHETEGSTSSTPDAPEHSSASHLDHRSAGYCRGSRHRRLAPAPDAPTRCRGRGPDAAAGNSQCYRVTSRTRVSTRYPSAGDCVSHLESNARVVPRPGNVLIPVDGLLDADGLAQVACPDSGTGMFWHRYKAPAGKQFICPSGYVGRVLVKSTGAGVGGK